MAVLRAGAALKHGTFVVASLLGRGGFGEVYLARQPRMDRDVAIKVLSPSVAEEDTVVRRFEREALAAGSLLHPNVLPVFDFDFDEETGIWFLAMQYIPGGRTLQSMMGGPMNPADVARIVTDIASALDAAHERGIVHRDVKPPNVLMDGQRPMLTDFGIAHLGSLTGITARGMAIGTPAYVSPEQGLGKLVGPRSDQYSLAVMTFQMLAGRPPFTGDSLSLVMQHVSNEPPALTTLNPNLPADIANVVAKALSKSPDDRYATCGEFASALTAAAVGASTGAMPLNVTTDLNVPPLPAGSAGSIEMGRLAGGSATPSEAMSAETRATVMADTPFPSIPRGSVATPAPVPAAEPKRLSTPILAAAGVAAIVVLVAGGLGIKAMTGSAANGPAPATSVPIIAASGASGVSGAPTAEASDLGVVQVTSNPQAVVVVDDEAAGSTPRELRLTPGDHELKLVASTFQDYTRKITVDAGKQLIVPPQDLVPLPAFDVINMTDSRVGKDPFVDAAGIVRLSTFTDSFSVRDDINVIAYVNPKTLGIRDLDFDVTIQWDRAGSTPAPQSAPQHIDKAWEQTFIRGCAPAAALDATGSNAPLTATILVDDQPLQTFSFRIGPGSLAGVQSECDKTVLPRNQAPA